MLTVAVSGFVIGVVLGSFVKATADRLIRGQAIGGRSYCERCKHTLKWYDLFPVFSYLLLSGKCRYCKKKIPLSNLLAELLTGILLGFLFYLTFPNGFPVFYSPWQTVTLASDLLFKIFTIAVLLAVLWIDLQSGLIPDRITFPATLAGVFYLLISSALKSWIFYQNLLSNPFGRLLLPPSPYLFNNLERIWISVGWTIGAAILLTLVFALLIVVTSGRGMGWGDVKYVLFLGLALGYPIILGAIFLAFFSGAVVSLGLIIGGKRRFGQTIPFGPFLSLGALIALFWGAQIINWYMTSFK